MPSWYFEKSELKNTPSLRDGIDSETEARYRREGARFIRECGNNMGLRYDTMATGVVFYHRFYIFHSFDDFPRYVMATCCLFLAGKVEETPKKCKDLVKAAKQWLESKNYKEHLDSFGDDPSKDIMIYERILLQTIKFDLQVDHPYGYLLKYAKTLKGNQEQIRAMVQMAWTFINDSYSTTLCLQWEPEIIAIALMYLTSKLSKLEITDWVTKKDMGINVTQNWWDQFVESLRIDILEDVCHQILDLYATQQQEQQQLQQPTNNTPQVNTSKTPNQVVNNPASSKRKTPPPSPLQQPNQINISSSNSASSQLNETTSPTAVKMLRTSANNNEMNHVNSHTNHNTDAYSLYNTNHATSLSSSSNSYYGHNLPNMYSSPYGNPSVNLQSSSMPPHIYHQYAQYSAYQSFPPTNTYPPPPPPPPPPPSSSGSNVGYTQAPTVPNHQYNPYTNHHQNNNLSQFNNHNNPYSMYSVNPSYMNNNGNGGNGHLSQYNNGIQKDNEPPPQINRTSNNNKQPHYTSSNSLSNNSNQMRTSALKTVNITDRPT